MIEGTRIYSLGNIFAHYVIQECQQALRDCPDSGEHSDMFARNVFLSIHGSPQFNLTTFICEMKKLMNSNLSEASKFIEKDINEIHDMIHSRMETVVKKADIFSSCLEFNFASLFKNFNANCFTSSFIKLRDNLGNVRRDFSMGYFSVMWKFRRIYEQEWGKVKNECHQNKINLTRTKTTKLVKALTQPSLPYNITSFDLTSIIRDAKYYGEYMTFKYNEVNLEQKQMVNNRREKAKDVVANNDKPLSNSFAKNSSCVTVQKLDSSFTEKHFYVAVPGCSVNDLKINFIADSVNPYLEITVKRFVTMINAGKYKVYTPKNYVITKKPIVMNGCIVLTLEKSVTNISLL